MKIKNGSYAHDNSIFPLMLKWKYCKLNEFVKHLSENNRCFVTSEEKVKMNPSIGSLLPSTKLPRTEKRQWERGHQKGLWLGDRWGGFDFKGFQSCSGLVLALTSLFQWFKQSAWSASALTRSLPLLLRTKGLNNATFSQSAATFQWPFLLCFSTFPLFFRSFLAFVFISLLVLHPVPSGAKVKEAGILSPFPFVKRCVLGISMATHIRGRVNPAFSLCGFGIFLCVDSEWCRTFVTQSCNN